MNYGSCFLDTTSYDKDGDENIFHTSYNNQDIASNIMECIPYIKNFFTSWIESIKVNTGNKKLCFSNLINPNDDYFFSFNYTKTLEHLYSVKNICHIHGTVGENLIFGHGNNNDNSEKYMADNIGTESIFSDIDRLLKKDTFTAIMNNKCFFKEISKKNISKIYTYGFSFAEVDLPYISEILENTSKDIT